MVSIFLNDNKARDGDLEWVVRGCTKIAEQEQANDLLFLPPPPPPQHWGGGQRDSRGTRVASQCRVPCPPGRVKRNRQPRARSRQISPSTSACVVIYIYIYNSLPSSSHRITGF
jgi:hypothetical protein